MSTDDARAEADAEAIRLAPVDDVFPSKNAQVHYRCGFRDGAEWAADRAETTTEATERIARQIAAWTAMTGTDAREYVEAAQALQRAETTTATTEDTLDSLPYFTFEDDDVAPDEEFVRKADVARLLATATETTDTTTNREEPHG